MLQVDNRLTRWVTSAFACALAIGLASEFVCASHHGSTVSAPVRNGVIIGPEKYRAVGLVTVLSPDQPGSTGIGTGTLIAPDLVITAAHVIDSAKSPHYIKFSLDGPGFQRSVVAFTVAPAYRRSLGSNTQTPEDDIALLRLDRAFPDDLEYYSIAGQDCRQDEPGVIVGFGLNETRKLNIRAMGNLKFYRKMKNELLLFVPGTDENQSVDSGDSGGPILCKRNDEWRIAGIVQAKHFFEPSEIESDEYDALDMSSFVDIRRHAEWVEKSTRYLESISFPERPQYISAENREQTDMPYSLSQLRALLQIDPNEDELFAKVQQRGLNEPWTDEAGKLIRSWGGSDRLVQRIDALATPVLTLRQVSALIKSGEDQSELYKFMWRRGGQFGCIDEEATEQLKNAGATDGLINALRKF